MHKDVLKDTRKFKRISAFAVATTKSSDKTPQGKETKILGEGFLNGLFSRYPF